MIYFAYGSNMLTYRLEKRIGEVEILGIGKLSAHQLRINKPSKDGSLKANAAYTGNDGDFIYGVLFKIDPNRRNKLDEFEGLGKGYDEKQLNITLVSTGENKEAFTYYATNPDETHTNNPYSWYMEYIVAGAEEHNFPMDYITFLKGIKSKEDEDKGQDAANRLLITEAKLPRKNLSRTSELVNELNKSRSCEFIIPGHALHGRTVSIYKNGREFSFATDVPLQKGEQTHKELDVSGQQILLRDGKVDFFINSKNFLINNITYDTDNHLKILHGSINALHTNKFNGENSYYRLLIPIFERLKNSDYESSGFTCNYRLYSGLIEIIINENKFHYFDIQLADQRFLVIESYGLGKIEDFQRCCNCILMAYSFLSGPYNADEGCFLSFETSDFNKPVGILYHSLGKTKKNDYEIFTTNGYTGIDISTLQREENGEIAKEERKRLYDGLRYFPKSVFSKICQMAFNDEKLLRTMVLLINNQASTLEMKLPVQYVTLETLSAALATTGNAELKPIKNDNDATELVKRLQKVITNFATEKAIDLKVLEPIVRKMQNMNQPPNADKLSKVFPQVGYVLSNEESQAINARNKFLHGSIPTFGSLDDDFKELFHLSLRVHFLIAVLVLKTAGFSGKIINHAKLFSVVTGKYLDEPPLKMI